MPKEYNELRIALRSADNAFRSALANRLEAALNQEIEENLSSDDYRSKKKAADWINQEAAQFGLALVCPKTGEQSMLVADRDYHRSRGIGVLHFEHLSGLEKSGIKRTNSCNDLPYIKVSPARLDQPIYVRITRPDDSKSRGR